MPAVSPVSTLLAQNQKFYDSQKSVQIYSDYCQGGLNPLEEKVTGRFLKPRSDLLVLGCGAGRECFPLAEKGHRVTGLDYSPRMLAEAEKFRRERGLEVRFVEGDFIQFPENLGKFDCLWFSQNIYSLIPTLALRLKTLQSAARFLKPGGFLLVFVQWFAPKKNPLYHNRLVELLRTVKRRLFDSPLREAPDSYLQEVNQEEQIYFCYFQLAEDIRREFVKAGLTLLYQEDFSWVLQPQLSKISSTSK